MTYQLHIGNKNYSSWSLRPWIAMRELGIPFTEHMHPFAQGEDFAKFSPSSKVPCLHDGTTVVWDSLAIVEYLAERHPGVWPSDPAVRAWARSAAAEMHSSFSALRSDCSMNCGVRIQMHAKSDALMKDLARIEALWSEGLAKFGGPFLAGPAFGGVDAFFAPVAFRARTYGLELGAPAAEYVERVLALPGMRAWVEAGLREPWRDPDHEADMTRVGTVIEDLRR